MPARAASPHVVVEEPEDIEPGEPEPPDWRTTQELVRKRFETAFHSATGDYAAWTKANVQASHALAAWLDKQDGDPERIVARALEGFFRDSSAAEKGFPIAFLAGNPARYRQPPKRLRDVRKGFVDPAPSEAFGPKLTREQEDAQLDALYGPGPRAEGGSR